MACRASRGSAAAPPPLGQIDAEGQWLVGRINPSNLDESRRVWRLISDGVASTRWPGEYVPIDWQLDFKSGFRWCEKKWYREVNCAPGDGADVKVPWELGRMQHLIQFAWAHALANEDGGGFLQPEAYAAEFRKQVLDFIAQNPPHFGVQWACTMDVAIRVANWLVAYDLFMSFGASFDKPFERVLKRSVYEHGRHIVHNLEWGVRLRHNHYLADTVGLLFSAAYLPATPETDAWLAFAIEELIHEVKSQFNAEGSSFEGSVCYHRLSGEMVAYATALVHGLPAERPKAVGRVGLAKALKHLGVDAFLIRFYRQTTGCYCTGGSPTFPDSDSSPFPPWYVERLERMAEFTMHVTKPNGRVAQIGDNDSGRFLKVTPTGKAMSVAEARRRFSNLADWTPPDGMEIFPQEDHLDHHHLVSAIHGLCPHEKFAAFCSGDQMDGLLVRALAGDARIRCRTPAPTSCAAERIRVGDQQDWRELEQRLRESEWSECRTTVFDFGDADRVPVTQGLHTYAYPAFGLYVFRSDRLFLAVRCGPVGRRGQGGHDHADQLSIELTVDGVDWIADPGTYVYTPSPQHRNQYRSVKAHFAPQAGEREPATLDGSLFALPSARGGTTIFFGPQGFAGTHDGYGKPIHRLLRIEPFSVTVLDCFPHETGIRGEDRVTLTVPPNPSIAFSPGYGIVRNR